MKQRSLFFILLLIILASTVFVFPRYSLPVTETVRQEAYSYAASVGKPLPPYAFSSDSCTFFPNRLLKHDFAEACLAHDIRYWLGGTSSERYEADLAFKEAIAHTGVLGKPLSGVMFWSVRTFGDSWLMRLHNANWGYGYNRHDLPF